MSTQSPPVVDPATYALALHIGGLKNFPILAVDSFVAAAKRRDFHALRTDAQRFEAWATREQAYLATTSVGPTGEGLHLRYDRFLGLMGKAAELTAAAA